MEYRSLRIFETLVHVKYVMLDKVHYKQSDRSAIEEVLISVRYCVHYAFHCIKTRLEFVLCSKRLYRLSTRDCSKEPPPKLISLHLPT